MTSLMPGAFFGGSEGSSSGSRPSRTSLTEGFDAVVHESAKKVVEETAFDQFQIKQKISKKTQRQAHLLGQLDTLVYFLVGYQFVKYCFSASLLPVVAHVAAQKLLSTGSLSDSERGYFLRFLSQRYEAEAANGVDEASRDMILDSVMSGVCAMLYWKSVGTIVYHIVYICGWLIPIANRNGGSLDSISNGTWWVVSFIGEYRPMDGWNDMSYFSQMVHLGLVGLVLSDLFILFIQLCIFQAIFKQSTISPVGRKLATQEVEVVRRQGDSFTMLAGDPSLVENDDLPTALRIRLYETFSWKAFNPNKA